MEIDVLTLHYKQNHYPRYTVREGGYLQIACFNVKEVYRKPLRNGYSVYGFSSR